MTRILRVSYWAATLLIGAVISVGGALHGRDELSLLGLILIAVVMARLEGKEP